MHFLYAKKNKAMIVAYLKFNGNTEEAFNFYKSVIGGEFTNFQRFGDTPHGEQMSETDKRKIMHITLKSPGGIIMGNDHLDFMGGPFQSGNNFSLSIHPSSEEETTQLFNGLSNGGIVTMPLDKVFWGAYFGMFIDKFGIQWIMNYEYSK
jgi:PhnB protein